MGRDWRQWAADRGIRKWFCRDNLLVLALTGVLLVIIAMPTREGKADGTPAEQSGQAAGESAPEMPPEEDYAAYLEGRLQRLLSRTAGVGAVEVMVTLRSSRELVVEKEQPVSRSSTNESDSQGGMRTVSEVDSRENTVYRTEGNASEPYVVKTLSPEIEGVLVVAEGAGDGGVDRTIAEIAQALFGVEAHRVKVAKMRRGQ